MLMTTSLHLTKCDTDNGNQMKHERQHHSPNFTTLKSLLVFLCSFLICLLDYFTDVFKVILHFTDFHPLNFNTHCSS